MTVRLFESEDEQLTAQLGHEPVTFTVDRFHVLYSEHGDTPYPWIVEDIIPLG